MYCCQAAHLLRETTLNKSTAKLGLLAILSSTLCISCSSVPQTPTGDVSAKEAANANNANVVAPIAVEKPVEAPKPVPAVPVKAAAKPCDFTTTLASDEAFASNKAALTSSAKSKLDNDVIGKLGNCGKVRLIMITGHADRLGSAPEKQKLSEKHADAVKSYLASKGVDANLTETMGVGKTQPAQGVPKCADNLPRKQMIACLAPHRRIVIEVKGTAK